MPKAFFSGSCPGFPTETNERNTQLFGGFLQKAEFERQLIQDQINVTNTKVVTDRCECGPHVGCTPIRIALQPLLVSFLHGTVVRTPFRSSTVGFSRQKLSSH